MENLPPDDEEALASRRQEDLNDSALSHEWIAEIDQRYADYKAGRTKAVPATTVFNRIRNRHGWNTTKNP